MPTLNEQVHDFAFSNLGKQVNANKADPGECWDLAEKALLTLHCKTSVDLTPGGIGTDSNYVWGTAVSQANMAKGNILQIRDYSLSIKFAYSDSSGSYQFDLTATAPHHTAIVANVSAAPVVEVLEQNANGVKKVTKGFYFFGASTKQGKFNKSGTNLVSRLMQLLLPKSELKNFPEDSMVTIDIDGKTGGLWIYEPVLK